MLREARMRWDRRGDRGFRWRGGEVSRLEGFSDAVFGFALTLLVVSVEVPHTFTDLAAVMRGFVAFAVCFALLVGVWERHYRFFRRFGLQDGATILWNGLLLFVVVFYVYPLKFLFGAVFDALLWRRGMAISAADAPALFEIYGAGFSAIFGGFFALHLHAWRHRQELELDPLELALLRGELIRNLLLVSVGVVSIALAVLLPPNLAGLAGFVYMLMGGVETWHGAVAARARRTLTPAA